MNFSTRQVVYAEQDDRGISSVKLIKEEPLSIRVQGEPYSIVMRTPGNEKEHAAGLCLTEGIVDKLEDIITIGFCREKNINIVTVTLTTSRCNNISEILKRKNYISNTSCGICGKEILADISTKVKPINDNVVFKALTLIKSIKHIDKYQPLRTKTKATHCSVIYDKNLTLLSSSEDVGRHNALDKSIGSIFINRTLDKAMVLTLSSRISYELVQKAAKARIPVVCAISRPTSLAVDLAKKLNITLATLSPSDGLIVYCNGHRLS